MELGYAFHWPAYGTPLFLRPDGVAVAMEVDGYMPYITEPPPRRRCLRACSAPLSAALPVVIPHDDVVGPEEDEMECEPSEPAPDDDE